MIRMNKAQKWLSFFALSMTGGIIFQVAYIRFVYLEPTYTALNLSSQQYGNIISAFGAVAIVMYFFGGWFSDKFSPKLLIVISLVGMGIADICLAAVPGFWGIVAVHILMAVVGMGLYWSALVKSISMLGDSGEQGRLFGFLEGTRGIVSTAIGFIGTAIVSASVVPAHGVLTLIRIYGVLSFVFAAVVLLVVREDKARLAGLDSATVTLKQLLAAARNRYTWLIGGTAMLMYCFYTTLGYFSPLLQDNYGVSASMIAVIGVVRSYVFQFVAGPAGGVVVDKVTRSSAVFLRWMFMRRRRARRTLPRPAADRLAGLARAGHDVRPVRTGLRLARRLLVHGRRGGGPRAGARGRHRARLRPRVSAGRVPAVPVRLVDR